LSLKYDAQLWAENVQRNSQCDLERKVEEVEYYRLPVLFLCERRIRAVLPNNSVRTNANVAN